MTPIEKLAGELEPELDPALVQAGADAIIDDMMTHSFSDHLVSEAKVILARAVLQAAAKHEALRAITDRAYAPALDRETIQTLLDLLNPLHGSLDEQTYDEKVDQNFDAPADAVYSVEVAAQMERDLTQAVCILESQLRDPQSASEPTYVPPEDER